MEQIYGVTAESRPTRWPLRLAPNLGLNSLDTPMFRQSVGSADPLSHIDFIAEHGFAGVEDNFLRLRTKAEQDSIGSALRRRGMAMGCFVANPAYWNQPLWVSSDPVARETLEKDLLDCIDAAHRCGGQVLTVLTGFDPHVPRPYQAAVMIENLRRLAPIAERAGVILGLEACNAFEYPSLFLNRVDEAFQMAQAVDSAGVGLVFDIYHVQFSSGNVLRNLERCWDRIAAIQFADNPGRTEAGTGEINWVNVFRAISRRGFTGLVEMEHEIKVNTADGEMHALQNLSRICDLV